MSSGPFSSVMGTVSPGHSAINEQKQHTDAVQKHQDNNGSAFAQRPLYLNQIHLARRWLISPRTLERWRWLGCGPRYLKIGGRVVYRLEDIEAFEASRLHECRG